MQMEMTLKSNFLGFYQKPATAYMSKVYIAQCNKSKSTGMYNLMYM
jgi:hypothetical protein